MTSLDPKGLQAAFQPDPEMFVCMDQTGCYHVSWNEADHRAKMAQLGATDEARYVRITTPSGEVEGLEVVAWQHKLTSIIRYDRPNSYDLDQGDYEPLVRLSEASTALASMKREVERLTALDAKRLNHIKKLERRIHNQRRSNRDNWMIAERRANWLGSQRSRRLYASLLSRYRLLQQEADALRAASQALGGK